MTDCDNEKEALYYALKCLTKIGDIAEEVSAHNYLDNTTIDLCADIGLEIEIQDIYKVILKEEAPAFHREYVEAKAQAIAEEMHP